MFNYRTLYTIIENSTKKRAHYFKKNPNDDDSEDEDGEDDENEEKVAVPLVEAMREMSKEQRVAMAPGGLDPLEVFEALPQEMQDCFTGGDVQALVELQKTMDPAIFNHNMVQCIRAGLWTQPDDDDDDDDASRARPGPPGG